MTCIFNIVTVLISLLFIKRTVSMTDFEIPVITSENQAWTVIDKTNLTLMGRVGSQLTLTCTASYPITWDYTGYQVERPFRIYSPKTSFKNGTFIYSLVVVNQFPKSASFEIFCKHFKKPLFSKVSVFVHEAGRNFKNVSSTVENNIIPCPTTNPRAGVELFYRNPHDYKRIFASYDRTKGFLMPQEPNEGTYICKTDTDSLTFVVENNHNKKRNSLLNFAPTEFWPFGKYIRLKCNSNGTFTTTEISNISLNSKYQNNTKFVFSSGDEIILASEISTNFASIACYNPEGTVIGIYNYIFIDPPKLQFNNRDGEMDCISETENKTIASLRCANKNDCNLLRYCFNDSLCQKRKDLYFYTDHSEGFCPKANFSSCISLQNYHYNGLVECAVLHRSKSFVFEFFTGLRLIKYQMYKDAPKEELIRMDEVSLIQYYNESSYFFCEAVKFLFADTFHYYLTFTNGSTVYLEQNKYIKDRKEKTEKRKVFDFNILSGISLFLPIDAVKLTCSVSLVDEPNWFNASRRFVVKYLSPPFIEKKILKFSFVRGRQGRLVCKATGEPVPKLFWTRKNSNTTQTLKSKSTTEGEEILEFSDYVDESVSGVYKCHAWNRIGNDSAEFIANLLEPPETILHSVIIGTVAIILVLILLSLYYWRQQRIAKEWLRELSDAEIEEFLTGNSEIWNAKNDTTQDSIQYMPYNNDYEIPISNLSMENKVILGNGQYGTVFRASHGLSDVAVKTTKPAADVLYFKALLTELKIMIYLGENENIVKLIGACTADIRMRSVYIIYELCSLGDLQNYLRENRENFWNDTDIHISGDHNDKTGITSKDLLLWSYQISCAMEYLTSKNVVHADLATRNVLLTTNKIAKLSDFGLSLQLYKEDNYVRRKKLPLPFRWMAIESLKRLQFSVESDIWSYGVTLWEIYSLADTPFPQETWNPEFTAKLTSGYRLAKPVLCPHGVYNFIMLNCWNIAPSERPSFTTIKDYIRRIIDSETNDSAMDKSKHTYENAPYHSNGS